MHCPMCASPMMKIIYMGLPGRLCTVDGCHCLTGAAAYAPSVASETDDGPAFAFMPYEGSYWRALWRWLTRPVE